MPIVRTIIRTSFRFFHRDGRKILAGLPLFSLLLAQGLLTPAFAQKAVPANDDPPRFLAQPFNTNDPETDARRRAEMKKIIDAKNNHLYIPPAPWQPPATPPAGSAAPAATTQAPAGGARPASPAPNPAAVAAAAAEARKQRLQYVLFSAINKGVLDKVAAALKDGASVGVPYNGYTPAHYAAALQKIDIAKYLVQRGAEIGTKEDAYYMLLHLAAFKGDKEFVLLLLKGGADATVKDSSGKQAWEYTKSQELRDMLKPALPAPTSPEAAHAVKVPSGKGKIGTLQPAADPEKPAAKTPPAQ